VWWHLQIYAQSLHYWNLQIWGFLTVADSIGLSSFTFKQHALEDVTYSELKVVNYSLSGPFKVIETGTNCNLICDLPLVVNRNLGHILYHFWDIMTKTPEITVLTHPSLIKSFTQTDPWGSAMDVKFATKQLQFSLSAACSYVHVCHWWKVPKITYYLC